MKVGRVYKIIARQGDEVYVGSTFNTTRDRFRKHKDDYKRWKDDGMKKVLVYDMFDKYGPDNCLMVLIQEYEVIDRRHLEVYENLWIKKLKSINNKEPCGGILRKQYYKNNKDKIKQYYEDNKDKINEKVECKICNILTTKRSINRHNKTKKHIDNMNK